MLTYYMSHSYIILSCDTRCPCWKLDVSAAEKSWCQPHVHKSVASNFDLDRPLCCTRQGNLSKPLQVVHECLLLIKKVVGEKMCSDEKHLVKSSDGANSVPNSAHKMQHNTCISSCHQSSRLKLFMPTVSCLSTRLCFAHS